MKGGNSNREGWVEKRRKDGRKEMKGIVVESREVCEVMEKREAKMKEKNTN